MSTRGKAADPSESHDRIRIRYQESVTKFGFGIRRFALSVLTCCLTAHTRQIHERGRGRRLAKLFKSVTRCQLPADNSMRTQTDRPSLRLRLRLSFGSKSDNQHATWALSFPLACVLLGRSGRGPGINDNDAICISKVPIDCSIRRQGIGSTAEQLLIEANVFIAYKRRRKRRRRWSRRRATGRGLATIKGHAPLISTTRQTNGD